MGTGFILKMLNYVIEFPKQSLVACYFTLIVLFMFPKQSLETLVLSIFLIVGIFGPRLFSETPRRINMKAF